MIFQNIIAQLATGIGGILGGCIVATLAEEELEQYQSLMQKSVKWIFVLTFLMPLFYLEEKIPLFILIISYSLLTVFYKQEKKVYYLLTPILLFLTTQNKEAFILTLFVFFLATMLTTMILLIPFVKKNGFQWSKETIRTLIHTYWIFFAMSGMLYGIVWSVLNNHIL